MRDNSKKQLELINNRINRAKTSLRKADQFAVPGTLRAEPADLIPLGRFPYRDERKDQENE